MGNTSSNPFSQFPSEEARTGSTKESAMQKLMQAVGSHYYFSSGDRLRFKETSPGLWKTNVLVYDGFGTARRASVNRLVDTQGRVYFRAWFGLAA